MEIKSIATTCEQRKAIKFLLSEESTGVEGAKRWDKQSIIEMHNFSPRPWGGELGVLNEISLDELIHVLYVEGEVTEGDTSKALGERGRKYKELKRGDILKHKYKPILLEVSEGGIDSCVVYGKMFRHFDISHKYVIACYSEERSDIIK